MSQKNSEYNPLIEELDSVGTEELTNLVETLKDNRAKFFNSFPERKSAVKSAVELIKKFQNKSVKKRLEGKFSEEFSKHNDKITALASEYQQKFNPGVYVNNPIMKINDEYLQWLHHQVNKNGNIKYWPRPDIEKAIYEEQRNLVRILIRKAMPNLSQNSVEKLANIIDLVERLKENHRDSFKEREQRIEKAIETIQEFKNRYETGPRETFTLKDGKTVIDTTLASILEDMTQEIEDLAWDYEREFDSYSGSYSNSVSNKSPIMKIFIEYKKEIQKRPNDDKFPPSPQPNIKELLYEEYRDAVHDRLVKLNFTDPVIQYFTDMIDLDRKKRKPINELDPKHNFIPREIVAGEIKIESGGKKKRYRHKKSKKKSRKAKRKSRKAKKSKRSRKTRRRRRRRKC